MNITARAPDMELTEAMDAFVRDSVETAFARLDHDIVAIDVYLKDLNGPKGGVDKQVLVCARLRNRQQVTVTTTHEDLYAAIIRGVRRTKRAVRRRLRRARHIRKYRMCDVLESPALSAVPKH